LLIVITKKITFKIPRLKKLQLNNLVRCMGRETSIVYIREQPCILYLFFFIILTISYITYIREQIYHIYIYIREQI